MIESLTADILVLLHLAFIAFVSLGGLLVLRWPVLAYLHIPCLLWGIAIELGGFICPLTPLEVHWRLTAGQAGYDGGFIDHYIMPLIYPPGLTRSIQVSLAVALVVFNGVIYGYLWARHLRRKVRRGS